jgi:hypothetical protein
MTAVKKIVLGAAVLVIGVGVSACGEGGPIRTPAAQATPHEETVSKTTFSGTWPFTISSGRLRCKTVIVDGIKELPQHVVTFKANGTTYAVNGAAIGLMAGDDIKAIWRKNHNAMAGGPRVSIGDVLDEGLNLCGVGSGTDHTTAEAAPTTTNKVETTRTDDIDTAIADAVAHMAAVDPANWRSVCKSVRYAKSHGISKPALYRILDSGMTTSRGVSHRKVADLVIRRCEATG